MTTTLRQSAQTLLEAVDASDREFAPGIKRKRLIEAQDQARAIDRRIAAELAQ